MRLQINLWQYVLTIVLLASLITACTHSSTITPAPVTAIPTSTAIGGSTNADTPFPAQPTNTLQPQPPVKTIDLCSLFTNEQVESLVGTALITATPGTDIDEVTGGPLLFCTYKGDDVALVISLAQSQAPQGSQAWQNQLAAMTNSGEPTTVTEEGGLGEKSYWLVNEDSAGWSVARYPYVFMLVVGGNISLAEQYKDDLKTLAEQTLAALP